MTYSAEVLLQLIRISLGKVDPSALSNVVLRDVVDWEEVYKLSLNQGVCALCADAVSLMDERYGIDEELRYKWIGQATIQTIDFDAKWNAANELGRLWSREGIRSVILKGFAYGLFYPNPRYREFCDLDCFLFEDWEQGNLLVEDLGIKVEREYYKNSSFTYKGLFVENHHYCSPIRGGKHQKKYEQYLQGLLKKGPLLPVNNSQLLLPPPLFNILFFMSHSFIHFIVEGGIQLRHVCDLAILLEAYKDESELFWKTFVDKCEEYGFLKYAWSVCQVARRVCGIEIPFNCLTNEQCDNAMLEDIMSPVCVQVDFGNNWKSRWKRARCRLQSAWKYKYYTDTNVWLSLFMDVWYHIVDRTPKLKTD